MCSNCDKNSEKRGSTREIMQILALEVGFWGVQVNKNSFKLIDNVENVKKNLFFEGIESLVKSLNPIGLFNVLLLTTLSVNLQVDFTVLMISLLKFNWMIYLLVISLLVLNILGKYSDFLFKNWAFDLSKLKKTKIQVK